jgi:hypothetical protein
MTGDSVGESCFYRNWQYYVCEAVSHEWKVVCKVRRNKENLNPPFSSEVINGPPAPLQKGCPAFAGRG